MDVLALMSRWTGECESRHGLELVGVQAIATLRGAIERHCGERVCRRKVPSTAADEATAGEI